MEIITREEAKNRGLKHYYTGIPCKHGHLCERRTRCSTCLKCDAARARKRYDPVYAQQHAKEYHIKNKKILNEQSKRYYSENKEQVKQKSKDWRARNVDYIKEYEKTANMRLTKQLVGLKRRARARNLEFNLIREEIVIPVACPVLGIPLEQIKDRTRVKKNNNTPTFDRVDNTKGYTKDNTRIISWKANKLKSNASLEELKAIVTYIEDHLGNQNNE